MDLQMIALGMAIFLIGIMVGILTVPFFLFRILTTPDPEKEHRLDILRRRKYVVIEKLQGITNYKPIDYVKYHAMKAEEAQINLEIAEEVMR